MTTSRRMRVGFCADLRDVQVVVLRSFFLGNTELIMIMDMC